MNVVTAFYGTMMGYLDFWQYCSDCWKRLRPTAYVLSLKSTGEDQLPIIEIANARPSVWQIESALLGDDCIRTASNEADVFATTDGASVHNPVLLPIAIQFAAAGELFGYTNLRNIRRWPIRYGIKGLRQGKRDRRKYESQGSIT